MICGNYNLDLIVFRFPFNSGIKLKKANNAIYPICTMPGFAGLHLLMIQLPTKYQNRSKLSKKISFKFYF